MRERVWILFARILQDEGHLNCISYWQSKGIGHGGKKTQPNPYKWKCTTISKMLTRQDYRGDIINFKTYSKSFKNRARLENAPENWAIFRDVHEPIIDRDTFEKVQKRVGNIKHRKMKYEENGRCLFSDFIYCADCGKQMWYHTNTVNSNIHFFSCSNYVKDYRGTCQSRHYIRVDAIEQIVTNELRRMAVLLRDDEEGFVDLLAKKTTDTLNIERRQLEEDLLRNIMRNEMVAKYYEKLYEENASGKVTDEWFLQQSHRYEVERKELNQKCVVIREKLASMGDTKQSRDIFIVAIRKFKEMVSLTIPMLQELHDHIDVYEAEGTGKAHTQRVTIFWRFVGYVELLYEPLAEPCSIDTREGVSIEYLPALPA